MQKPNPDNFTDPLEFLRAEAEFSIASLISMYERLSTHKFPVGGEDFYILRNIHMRAYGRQLDHVSRSSMCYFIEAMLRMGFMGGTFAENIRAVLEHELSKVTPEQLESLKAILDISHTINKLEEAELSASTNNTHSKH